MFKKINKLKIFVITILVSMVFAVNIGITFANIFQDQEIANNGKVDYTMPGLSTDVDQTADKTTYLNEVVVNNSTTNIPIAYTLGTVQREINFDYSFSDPMDVAVKYTMEYTDGTEVNNVILNIVDRDQYIVDQDIVHMANYASAYDSSSPSGTMYYLGTIQGNGTKKLFEGVTFLSGNNKVNSYKSVRALTIGNKVHNEGDEISVVDYEYTFLEVSRFWEINTTSKAGPVDYVCIAGYTLEVSGNDTVQTRTKDQILKAAEYDSYITSINNQIASYWQKQYVCSTGFTAGENTYVAGQYYTESEYNYAINLSQNNKDYFAGSVYKCVKGYTITANNNIVDGGNNVSANKIISAEEYALLLPSEQANFSINEYKTFENKNLRISVQVYTSLSGVEYPSEHYFKNLKADVTSLAFSNWLKYKKNEITQNVAMIYNSHATFADGIPYAIDFSAGQDMTAVGNLDKEYITSSYIYKDGKFYTYAGGNKYNAGIGVYYMTANSPAVLNVQVSASWYNSNGDKINSMPINTINLVYANNGTSSFSKTLSANSCGYVDVLDYIQTITEGALFDMSGYYIVISSVTASFSNASGTSSATSEDIKINNSTAYNPILYRYNLQPYDGDINFNITITNNTDNAISVPTVTLSPEFTAYNGSTSISTDTTYGYGVASTVIPNGITYKYDSSVWSVSGNVFTGNGYIAPHSSLTVVSGITFPAGSIDWSFSMAGVSGFGADYWFEVGATYVESNTAVTYTTNNSYSSAEVMTTLMHTKESTQNNAVVSYIGIRNNTLQKITKITYNGTLQLGNVSDTFDYSLESSVTPTKTGNSFTIILSNIELYPGESVYICKITVAQGKSHGGNYMVSLVNSNCVVELAANQSTRSGIYFKRDFVSGNLSIVNSNASGTTEKGLQINNVTSLLGGSAKWNGSNQFIMQDTVDDQGNSKTPSLAKFRNGQIILLRNDVTSNISGYGYTSLTISAS